MKKYVSNDFFQVSLEYWYTYSKIFDKMIFDEYNLGGYKYGKCN